MQETEGLPGPPARQHDKASPDCSLGELIAYSSADQCLRRSKHARRELTFMRPLRVALVHSQYLTSVPSGENAAVSTQTSLLRDVGIDVIPFVAATDDLRTEPFYSVRSGLRTAFGIGRNPHEDIEIADVDVVHLHNLFPNYGTRWLRELSVPFITTLHNYRSVCANGLLFRDGQSCQDRLLGRSTHAVKHACYRNSRLKTLPLAISTQKGPSRVPQIARAHRVVVLSQRARARFISQGVSPDRLVVLANSISRHTESLNFEPHRTWLFVVRLSQEKGILRLIQDFPKTEELHVIGDGPQRQAVTASGANIHYLGPMENTEVRRRLPNYHGLIFPSLCEEMCPTVVLEAFASGVPVVARSGTTGSDLVDTYRAGATYTTSSDLAEALVYTSKARPYLSFAAQQAYERDFTPEAWSRQMQALYESAVQVS